MTELTRYGVVFVLLVVIATAFGASLSTATNVYTATNESITVDYTSPSTVDNTVDVVSYYDNESIRNASGSALVEGTDYEWNTSTGEVTWLNTAATSDGETADISYAYDRPSDRSLDFASVLQLVLTVLAGLILLMGAFVVLGWLNSLT